MDRLLKKELKQVLKILLNKVRSLKKVLKKVNLLKKGIKKICFSKIEFNQKGILFCNF